MNAQAVPQLADRPDAARAGWRGFLLAFAAVGALAAALMAGVIAWANPYGLGARAGREPVLLDSNQRFMYPQLVRSGRFDAAILGTSSVRLVDPARLSGLTGERFANLAMNAATPWEQVRLARLFREEGGAPKLVIWGIDTHWCEADATSPGKRLTPRPFPEWLYARGSWFDLPRILNFTTFEISSRRFGILLGKGAPRMRADGFDEFTPPDATYDLERARFHLYRGQGGKSALPPPADPGEVGAARPEPAAFPALAWLEAELAALPAETRRVLVLPPLHVASMPAGGTEAARRGAACKATIAALAARSGAALVDFYRLSPVTTDDSRFWDPMHYRIDVARRIEDDLAAVAKGRELAHPIGILRVAPRR